jgi:conjugative transfer signal peptidase TraF
MARLTPLIAGLMASTALVLSPLARSNPFLIWNVSPSVQVGLYTVERRAPTKHEIATLRLPPEASRLAEERGYLPSSAWLLKPVAAESGDVVCRLGRIIFVNGRLRAKALLHDKAGRLMPDWNGCSRLRKGQYFILSKRWDSFDSRYFGAVDSQHIVGRAELVFSLPE